MSVDFGALTNSAMSDPGRQGIAIEDLNGSEFIGTITLRIVPSPGPLAVAGIGGLALIRRRR